MAGASLPLAPVAPAESPICCTPGSADVIDVEDANRLARAFKALSDPGRVRLLSLIAAQDTGDACVCDLTDFVGLTQPTVSHHMKQLVEAGLVVREQRGRWAYYRVNQETLAALSRALRTDAMVPGDAC